MGTLTAEDLLQINKIIAEMNQFQDHKKMRKSFLMSLRSLVDYDLAIFDLSKTRGGVFIKLYDPVVNSIFDSKYEDEFISKYDNEFSKTSYSRWLHFEKKSLVYKDSDFIDKSLIKNTRYYNEFLLPMGLSHSCGCEIAHDKLNLACLSLFRKYEKSDFNLYELDILQQFLPHLVNYLAQKKEINYQDEVRKRLLDDYGLTHREMEVLELIFLGYENNEISEKLYISINTVKKHINNIFSKMDIKSRVHVINFLMENEYYIQK